MSISSSTKHLAVIGMGYIGLPTAVFFAKNGWGVTGVDVKEEVVAAINNAQLPFVEPGLDVALREVVNGGALHAQVEVPRADIFIISVPTPVSGGEDRRADLSYVDSASLAVAEKLCGGELVVLESTVPPGATRYMADLILAARPDLSEDGSQGRPVVHFAHAPERVIPGSIMEEMATNDRIIGGLTEAATEMARAAYASFCEGAVLTTDATTAELSKLTENSFRDVNIAFANELSMICDNLGVDVWELISLANRHPRVNVLGPGPGVGGHCIPIDPWFIYSADPNTSKLIKTARLVNDSKPLWVLKKIKETIEGVETATIAALGIAFKPDVDDLRESPAIAIVKDLAQTIPGVQVNVVEPNIDQLPTNLATLDNVKLIDLAELGTEDVTVLLVGHKEFKGLDLESKGQEVLLCVKQ